MAQSYQKETHNFFTQKRIISIIIAIQLLALSGFVYTVYKFDKKYSWVLSQASSDLYDFQRWSSLSNQNFIRLFDAINQRDSIENAAVYEKWLSNMHNSNNFVQELSKDWDKKTVANINFNQLIEKRQVYLNDVEQFFALKKNNQWEKADAFFFAKIKPDFLAFQNQLVDIVGAYHQQLSMRNAQISLEAQKATMGYLMVSLSPAIGFALIFVFFLAMIVWLAFKLEY
ncbi:MAG: hypothetical protein JNL70_01435 [Saprospiraceae bacterium]|nr:hypothetical protein [Saprospiraceae bacterium]